MTWHNKVVWTEGMFLQPQHFQQHDRYLEWQMRARLAGAVPYAWGYTQLAVDDAALALGKIALTQASGLLPDGTAFALPGNDLAPAALDVPPDTRNELILLVATLQRPGLAETDAEEPAGSPGPRFSVAEIETSDNNANGQRDAPVQVGRLNLRLMRARDIGEAYATLGVVRVVERRADNRVVLDPQYVPPLLHAPAHPVLDGYVRELLGLLHHRGEALAQGLSRPGAMGMGTSDTFQFLLLEAVNRNEATFAHYARIGLLHPERLYAACLALAGDLATFRVDKRAPAYPEYVHDDLARSFRPVIDDVRQSLSMVIDHAAIQIELQERKHGLRVAVIPDRDLLRSARFVLAVTAQMPSEALRVRFPTQTKIGPAERIRDLVTLALPGVGLRPMQQVPREIPFHKGYDYFELETHHSDLWKQLDTSGGLTMHVAGDFPGLELEFWAIRA
jgi:type VI secretion system protein ImpJ